MASNETRYEHTITCPACKYEFGEPYELFQHGNECNTTECHQCGKELDVTQHIDIKYSARIKENVNG